MKLSIVIPAFDESGKIGDDIKSACQFLQRNGFSGEVIIADDGSTDGTAEAAIKAGQQCQGPIEVKVIRNEHHRGKGYAIRSGIKQAAGEYIMFADSGNCVPYDNALRGLNLLASGGCDIAHGSRKIAGANIINEQGLYRRICSGLFHWFVIHAMRVPAELTDTQCGFKIYRGDVARRLYGECTTDGFMFDIEIILRAMKQGCRIKEFPIDWTCDIDSRLSPAKSIWRILADLMKIRKTLH
ncbi:MAG: glycosyltransferase [Sedimentisphaerales bacterium]|jgi:dolichyl-phosphate beta-glucosyltransferase